MRVSHFLVAFSALCIATTSGLAADSTHTPDRDYNWAGFYLGVYGAYGKGTSESDVAPDIHPSDPFPGIHAGYLFDLGNVVLGLEGDASLSDLDDDIRIGPALVTQDVDNIASLRARIGLPLDKALLSANAGWAWADSEYSYLIEKDQKMISGPTVGVGAQYAFSHNFIARLEYNHYFYGTTTYDLETQVDVKNSLDEIRVGVDFLFH